MSFIPLLMVFVCIGLLWYGGYRLNNRINEVVEGVNNIHSIFRCRRIECPEVFPVTKTVTVYEVAP